MSQTWVRMSRENGDELARFVFGDDIGKDRRMGIMNKYAPSTGAKAQGVGGVSETVAAAQGKAQDDRRAAVAIDEGQN